MISGIQECICFWQLSIIIQTNFKSRFELKSTCINFFHQVWRNSMFFRKSVQQLGLADDMSIIAPILEKMTETYIRLKIEATRFGLAINASKIKYTSGYDSGEFSATTSSVMKSRWSTSSCTWVGWWPPIMTPVEKRCGCKSCSLRTQKGAPVQWTSPPHKICLLQDAG